MDLGELGHQNQRCCWILSWNYPCLMEDKSKDGIIKPRTARPHLHSAWVISRAVRVLLPGPMPPSPVGAWSTLPESTTLSRGTCTGWILVLLHMMPIYPRRIRAIQRLEEVL
ncbi:hypothetical protein PVAP13_8NG217000 [Panicum virgatum]|uniref:Uncharacterized protein n=1 Tax=Panicum virgatum TaxID=38727 RepID=A0A8T0P987_PANVG|nr:hypothetical protein PVAP13_8NG217000 [Panicum virgatum]